jgi:putative SOS response-associated peptidase YedK
MCGRYTHKLTWAEIVKLYQLTLPDQEPVGFKASYNVAPTDIMPIIRPAGAAVGNQLLGLPGEKQ